MGGAYFMAKTHITIDLGKLTNAISNYEIIISDFEQAVKETEEAIKTLKSSGWKSSASTQYFLTYENTWKKNMKKRIEVIKHLKKCLEKAKNEYQGIYDEMNQLDSALN